MHKNTQLKRRGFSKGDIYNGVICDYRSLYTVRFYATISVGKLIIIN